MLYLTQAASAAFITAIRIVLQIATMYLLKNIVSRTYNLTYMERIDAGVLSKLHYIFMARLTTKKYVFGRVMVLIALIISIALTALPTLLNKIYPVQTVYLPSNNRRVSFDYNRLQLTKVEPKATDISILMQSMGIPATNERFFEFRGPSLPVSQCTHALDANLDANVMRCFGNSNTTVKLGTFYDANTAFLYDTETSVTLMSPNTSISSNNSSYRYFQMKVDIDNLARVYGNLSPVFQTDANDTFIWDGYENGVRSLEGCVALTSSYRQCVRNSLGYIVVQGEGVLVIKKKLIYEGVVSYQMRNMSNQDGGFCSRLATPNLREMCDLTGWNWPETGMFGYQSMINTTQGIRFDILWLGHQFGAISLDISVVGYAGTLNTTELWANYTKTTNLWGQELFEATKIYLGAEYQNSSNWFNWGFSQNDIDNMTSFLIHGSPMFGGSIVLTRGELLAEIPGLFLGMIIGSIVLMFFIGYMVGRGVDPVVGLPLSEIIVASASATATSNSKSGRFWNRKEVANLTLRRPTSSHECSEKAELPPTIHADGFSLVIQSDKVRLLDEKE
ncbi:hypothetical protein BGX26_012530 [Mortierella sp. AD094]|nr:hypothetical protein BGX26_012530 [Mortierella sp. AD094]